MVNNLVQYLICSSKAHIFPFSVKGAIRKEFFSVYCSNHYNKANQHALLLEVKIMMDPLCPMTWSGVRLPHLPLL